MFGQKLNTYESLRPLEVVVHGSDTQLQVAENLDVLTYVLVVTRDMSTESGACPTRRLNICVRFNSRHVY